MTTKRNATHTTNCRRCHGLLTDPRSVAKKIGRTCERNERRERAARDAGFKPAAVDKARQLIADRAIVRLRGRFFQVVSSNGVDRYLTAPETCNCPAGLKARHACYHRAAATMLAA